MMPAKLRQPPFPRQPDLVVITPSNQSPWISGIDEGERFTRAQIMGLANRGLKLGEVVTVFREATTREMWWSTLSAPPVFQFDCPVLQRLSDGRIKVLAPSGEANIVLGNGWVRMPSRGNRHLLKKDAA